MKIEKPQVPLHVLLADDDEDDSLFFKEALKEFPQPTQLTVVHDGEQLMELLSKQEADLPNVLFLDLNMPRKNGFECLSAIKSNEKLKELPVIIYSTSFHKEISDLLYTNGANYYISKPSEISKLKTAVHMMLTLISHGTFAQPEKENFVLTSERKNAKRLFWFNHFFIIPFTQKIN